MRREHGLDLLARGLVFDLAVTGDREAVDTAMDIFTDLVRRGT